MTSHPLIEAEFVKARTTPLDIHEHMDRLYELALECDHIVEGGVRYVVSTWAFILGCACRGGKVVSYCWNMLPEIQRALDTCASDGVAWEFHEGDWLKAEIPETDLLFIDTNHMAAQLREELRLHAPKSRKFLVFHDTTRFGEISQDGTKPGLMGPINELVAQGEWEITEQYSNCNGLVVCRRRKGYNVNRQTDATA